MHWYKLVQRFWKCATFVPICSGSPHVTFWASLMCIKFQFKKDFLLDAQRQPNSVLWNHSRPSAWLFVRLSVCPSVTNLSQDWIIILYIIQYIIHDNNWVWYLVMDKAGFLKKELVARIWVKGAKIGPKHKFFAIFSSLAR